MYGVLFTLALITGTNANLDKRQNATFSFNRPGNGSDTVTSEMPLDCVAGCFKVSGYYQVCSGIGSNVEPCTWLCGQHNYTLWVQCLNCVVANGEQDVTPAQISQVLENTNSYCTSASGFAAASITATPTTTGPFSADFTEATTATGQLVDYTFPIWTGLATLANPNFLNDLNSEIAATMSSNGAETNGPVIVGSGAPTGMGLGQPSGQHTPTRSAVEGPTIGQGSASAKSAAATTSGAATRMEGGVVGGLAGMILAVILA